MMSKLLALLGSLLVAVLAAWLLTRHERKRVPRALLEGYPPAEFERIASLERPLSRLCQTQLGLLALYRRLPARSPARASLLAFLEELRALMDGAYDIAALHASPEAAERLETLAAGAATAGRDMAAHAERLANADDSLAPTLEARVEVMRALARHADDI